MAGGDRQDRDEMIALAPARREVYAFLSSAFAEPPSEESLAALRSDVFLSSAAAMFSEQTLTTFRRYGEAAGYIGDLKDQAHQEFMNLFKVPGGQYVSPYESVYRDTRDVAGQRVKGLLMGPSAVDVQKWYRLAAVEICDEYKDLPDHVCLELNYLAHLCAKEQEFASTKDWAKLARAWEMQRDFLAAHVVTWLGELRDKIHEKSHNAYFRALADMAVEFTQRDLATLEGVVDPSKSHSALQRESNSA